MANGVMNVNSFDSSVYRPGLKELFRISAESVDSKINILFDRQSSKLNYEQFLSSGGLGNFQSWSDGTNVGEQSFNTKYKTTIQQADYATSIQYTRQMKRWEQYGMMKDMAKEFGLSAATTQEQLGAAVYNGAFTTVWNATEAKYLIASDHPVPGASGGVYSNLVTGGLSISTIQSAITKLRLTPTEEGKPMQILPKYLVVPPALEWLARSILESPGEYDNGNNAKNTLAGKLQIVVWDYLTSETAWFILGNKHKFKWFDGVTLTQDMIDYKESGNTRHMAMFAAACAPVDWRGVVGSTGA